MNEQEMQFADPDWQPAAQVPGLPPYSVNDAPLPVNARYPVWQNGENGPGSSVFVSSYKQGHQGKRQILVIPPVYQQTSARLGWMSFHPRRQRLWFWLVAIFFLIWLIPALLFGTMSQSFNSPGNGSMKFQTFNYDMENISALKIDNLAGSIHVHGGTSGPNGEFDVQSSNSVANPLQFVPGTDGALTVQVKNPPDGSLVLLDITLPQNMALNLSTTQGEDIEIEGMRGQVNLQTTSSIDLLNDTISGQSTISAGPYIEVENGSISGTYTITAHNGMIDLYQEQMSGHGQIQINGTVGDMQLVGTLDPQGAYAFTTDSGQITLQLPGNSAMQLTIEAGTGTSSSDFSKSTGNGPQAQVTLRTNSGDINVRRL